MTSIFADTYYWLALINSRDSAHNEAVNLSRSISAPIITSEWVLTEVGDALRKPGNRPVFLRLLRDIANDPQTTVISAEHNWFDQGVALYSVRLDKQWPLTDCISFVIMQSMGITEALTGDSEFVQAGFRKLMD